MKALLKNLVGSVAPTLGTALGGPMGGMAANMIADVLGCKNEPKEIQKNRFYTQSLKKEDARRGGDTFCNKLQKKLLILEEYKSENYYSLIFECN